MDEEEEQNKFLFEKNKLRIKDGVLENNKPLYKIYNETIDTLKNIVRVEDAK